VVQITEETWLEDRGYDPIPRDKLQGSQSWSAREDCLAKKGEN